MSEKFKVEKEDEKDKKDQFIFKVYMPNNKEGRELKNKLISYAKLHHNNAVWKVIRQGIQLIMDSEEAIKIDHERRIENLEQKIQELSSSENKEREKPQTFGD